MLSHRRLQTMAAYIALFTVALLACISYSYGCTCDPDHGILHNAYCWRDYVIRARVLGYRRLPNSGRRYRVYVQRTYKGSIRGGRAYLFTGNPAMCGINLRIGRVYILTGDIDRRRLIASTCWFHKEYRYLTPAERYGLNNGFDCRCEVCHPYVGYKPSRRYCLNGKKTREMCVYRNGRNGRCVWRPLRRL